MLLTKRKVRLTLAAILGTMIFGCLAFLFLRPIPEPNQSVLQVLIGALCGSWVTVVAFYFGDPDS